MPSYSSALYGRALVNAQAVQGRMSEHVAHVHAVGSADQDPSSLLKQPCAFTITHAGEHLVAASGT